MRFCAPVLFIVSLFVSGCSVSNQQSIPDCAYVLPTKPLQRLLTEQPRDWASGPHNNHSSITNFGNFARDENGDLKLPRMKQGLWTKWYEESVVPNGQQMMEGTYENGMKQGLWTMWHENGQKMMEAGLEIGMAEGIFRMWYDNGQIREEGIYKNSEKNGICRGWHEDGTINAELSGIYKDGKKISNQE